jgi:8-oxo-dGTP pyrophosphatase MutT (NUDIX family)
MQEVTAFVTRIAQGERELLLFRHPYAGTQIPAGTVEENETPEEAVRREVLEETGLSKLYESVYLGFTEEVLDGNQRIIAETTKVHARPDPTSSDWAYLRRGIRVQVLRTGEVFSQISYVEYDQYPHSEYVSMNITGWIENEKLDQEQRRHYYYFEVKEEVEETWQRRTDNHIFTLFWASLKVLPEIVYPQSVWLEQLHNFLKANRDPQKVRKVSKE